MSISQNSGGLKQPQLTNFTFTEKLGQGSYASVYKAFKKVGQREVVAVKCILKTSLNSISKENLLTEIEVLKALKHRHIIQLKDFLWDDNYIYLITEYCSGGDLSKYLKKYRIIPENVAKYFLQQLASALQFMRSKLISHMDLKPSNILLTSTNSPILKIGDFGFAHYLDGLTEASYLRGSLLYMAPEIITMRLYNENADLWSVGIILYECLFGRTPFQSSSESELRSKIKSNIPIKLPAGSSSSVTDSCRDLLTRLLERDPERRMNYEEFFGHPFLDMEHAPSGDSLRKAMDLVQAAVANDGLGKYKEAVDCYCQSVEHFIAAIKYTEDSAQKELLRKKVSEYLSRAELLKMKFDSQTFDSQVEENSLECNQGSHIAQQWQSNNHYVSAQNLIKSAEAKVAMEQYDVALEKYEAGLGILLELLKDEPPSERKDTLLAKMSTWMSRAERLKQLITIRSLRAKNSLAESEMGGGQYTCIIQ